MESFFKIVVVWLTLFTAPVQGFAAAMMVCCAPAQAPMMMQGSEHALPNGHQSLENTDMAHDCCMPSGTEHEAAGQCAMCAACMMGTVPSVAQTLPVLNLCSAAVPFYPQSFYSHIPATPEHPPQAFPV